MAKTETKTKTKTKNEPTAIFAGKREKFNKQTSKREKVAREAPTIVINGRDKIKLPPSAEQRKGFFIEAAPQNTLATLFPSDYKPLKKN